MPLLLQLRPARMAALVLLSFLVLGSLAACGGDDDDAGASTPEATATTALASPTSQPTLSAETAPVLPASVTDKDGNTVQVKDTSRIVVINGDLAEIVYALGLGESVVGVDTSATYPPEAKAKQNIGYQRSLSAEGILSLNPTVILGNENAGPPPVIEQLKGAGATVVLFKNVNTLEGISGKILNVGTALGVPKRSQALAERTQSEIDAAIALGKTAKSQPNVAFLVPRGATTQFIMGAGSGADAMLKGANVKDAGVTAGIKGSAPITAEILVTAQPEVLVVPSSALESVGGVDGLLKIPGIELTPAGKDRAVVSLEDQYLFGLGPRAGQALMELVRLLHPDLKG